MMLCVLLHRRNAKSGQMRYWIRMDDAGTGQAIVAATVSEQMLAAHPGKHVIYLTDRVHLLYQQAAVFTSQLDVPVGRYCVYSVASQPVGHKQQHVCSMTPP